MTDETNVAGQQEDNQKQEVDYKGMVENLQKELTEAQKSIEALAKKKDELLNETKAAKDEKRKAAEEVEKAKLEQAQKNGEFEKLWKNAKEEVERERQEKEELRKTFRKDKINIKAMEIANELADGNNAKILTKFIAENLDNIADDVSTLSADVIKDIKKEFETNELYQSLLRSSKATGGGAPGNMKTVQEKEDLSKLSAIDRLMKINEQNLK